MQFTNYDCLRICSPRPPNDQKHAPYNAREDIM